jgi:hypothetical protein
MAKPLALVPDLEAELDGLFGLPPEEFTSARNDLAKRLKDAGQAETAERIKKLKKPTTALWAVNQLARRNPDEIAKLLDAGARLRAAQESALGGGDPADLRSASAAEREAVRVLTHQARGLLAAAGHGTAVERVAATLRAAAVEPQAHELLAAGRLPEEVKPGGFDALEGLHIVPRARSSRPKPAAEAAERRQHERVAKLRERAAKLQSEASEAEREAERVEVEAARARRKADKTSAAAERAAAELEAAEGEG